MSRYLAYTSPARGHLYPIVPTLLELRARGHDVHVRTLATEVTGLRAAGLHAGPIDPAIEHTPLDDWEGSTPEQGLARALATFGRRAAIEVPDLRNAIDEVSPDALLIDITTIGSAALAEASTLPWARWIPLFQHVSFDGRPPDGVTYVPFAIDPAGLGVLNAPRAAVGLEPLGGAADVWRAPLHLYLTATPLEPDELVFPSSFRLTGPGIWEPPAVAPSWLDELADPLVLVSASSEFQPDDGLVAIALEALGGEDVSVVVTTAAHDPAGFQVPANARVERWLPHQPLIDRAACVVCHGGMGITQKALAAGVPVCVVPFGRDQFEVAGRVVATGAGAWLPPQTLDPGSLRSAIQEAMTKRAGAQAIARSFAAAGGAPAAADALEALVETVAKNATPSDGTHTPPANRESETGVRT